MRLRPGEPEATGWRVTALADVVEQLRRASPGVTGRPRVIAIDGRGGAGKTTLATRLGTVAPNSAVVHTDDVAWNHACFDWGALLTAHVLEPLHRGEPVDYRPDAWVAHGRPGSIIVPAGLDFVWVEGTGVIREELARWRDASIYLQGNLDDQDRLLLARDGDSPEVRENATAWMAEELPFLLREQPWSRATLIAAGPPRMALDPYTELVVAPPVGR